MDGIGFWLNNRIADGGNLPEIGQRAAGARDAREDRQRRGDGLEQRQRRRHGRRLQGFPAILARQSPRLGHVRPVAPGRHHGQHRSCSRQDQSVIIRPILSTSIHFWPNSVEFYSFAHYLSF